MSDQNQDIDNDNDSADKIRQGLKGDDNTNDQNNNDDNGGGDDADKQTDKPKISDNEAKLVKEVMKHKATAKKNADDLKALQASLEGIDLDEVRTLLAKREEDENKTLEKKGEFDRLLAKQKTAADAAIKAATDRADAAEAEKNKLLKNIEDLTIGSSFANSKFVTEKLTLTPNKAKALYKSHFEFVDGKQVAYDKPRGESDRTMIVGADGQAVDFETAISSIIDNDPDKDYLIKADMKPGGGSKKSDAEAPKKGREFSDTTDKIMFGLEALTKANKK